MNTMHQPTTKHFRLEIHGAPSGANYYADATLEELRKFADAPRLRPEMKTPDHVAPEDGTHYRASVAVGFRMWDFEQTLLDLDTHCRALAGQPFSFDAAFPKGRLASFHEAAETVPALNERSRRQIAKAFEDGFESANTGRSLSVEDFAKDCASVVTLGADFFAIVVEEESRGPQFHDDDLDPVAPGIAPGSLAEIYRLGHRSLSLGACLAQFLALRSRGHSLQALTNAAVAAVVKQLKEQPIQPVKESVLRRWLAQ